MTVVSNRQPYRHEYTEGDLTVDRPTGGLTAALDPVMQQLGGTWIAWGDGSGDGDVVDAEGVVPVPPDAPRYRLKRVWLSPEQVVDYYDGFSNQVLWPICHSALTKVRCEPAFWRRYRQVNARFADAVVGRADDRPLVWFQDYHLALAPAFVRDQLPAADLLHFWHVPWPAWDTFRACPHGRRILEALLANDVIGLHVPRYRSNFLDCVDAALPDATVEWEAGRVRYRGTVTAVEAVPMGVPVDRIRRLATPPAGEAVRESHAIDPGTRLAVGVDRLDYTKGIVERLRALERFWERSPRWRGALTYVQVGSESRSRIPAYREVQARITAEIDRINRRFGTDGWRPIVSITSRLPTAELYGLYRLADIALVSALRDGMNLVAQEYVAAQVGTPGVLVLSDQVGVHDLFGEAAVTVTPTDIDRFADAIDRALSMPEAERDRRLQWLSRVASDHDLTSWLARNLAAGGVGRVA